MVSTSESPEVQATSDIGGTRRAGYAANGIAAKKFACLYNPTRCDEAARSSSGPSAHHDPTQSLDSSSVHFLTCNGGDCERMESEKRSVREQRTEKKTIEKKETNVIEGPDTRDT